MTDQKARRRMEEEDAARRRLESLLPGGHPYPFIIGPHPREVREMGYEDDEGALYAIRSHWETAARFKSFPMDFRWAIGDIGGATREGCETAVDERDADRAAGAGVDGIRRARTEMTGSVVICLVATENEHYLAALEETG